MITVGIPVGPLPEHRRWLPECLESICNQTVKPQEIVLISDMCSLSQYSIGQIVRDRIPFRIWESPWHLGVAHAFNFAVALSKTNLVITLGADDTLEPTCIEQCRDAYLREPNTTRDLSYFYLGVKYMDTNEEQSLPCQAAMVSQTLWKHTGGLPVESASGAPDASFISILLAQKGAAGHLVQVNAKKPLYNYRRHNATDTAQRAPWQGVILPTRDLVTRLWQQPTWERF